MTPLAQELLDIDKPTLKSCALASSRLHTMSQHGLFSSFRVSLASPSQAPTTSYMVINGHFLQSPRLAGYVTTLTVEFLPTCYAERDVSAIRSLLAQLKCVRYCTLDSEYTGAFTWGTNPLSSPILDFIRRQNLLELQIRYFSWIPPTSFAAFFCATQTLGLHHVAVQWSPPDHSATFPDAKVEYLHLTNSNSALDKLHLRQFAPLAANVRRMRVTVDSLFTKIKFTPEMAGRLEYLRVEWPPSPLSETPIDPTEPLVALRTLDLSYCSLNRDVEPSSVTILEPLFSCTTAALAEIRFSYSLGKKIFRKHYFHAGTLQAVAAVLEICPGAPRISWCLSVEGNSARKERELAKFTALLQVGLPHIHEEGRLFVQNRAFADDWNHTECLSCSGSVSTEWILWRKVRWPERTSTTLSIHDEPTLTELALYQQVINHPYMAVVHAPEGELNAINLGPLHI
ncbi:hypothetical protein GGX14DRAFT_648106 [Mycena pura]|uniref:Uncharacterized protein n=1 Tax=Mycena pura TaxID=153505 RepID=A0AAD6Y9J6_9AGAR|nr:hypothetical protein GGX14DRAFT_648106 [Mycena pura]